MADKALEAYAWDRLTLAVARGPMMTQAQRESLHEWISNQDLPDDVVRFSERVAKGTVNLDDAKAARQKNVSKDYAKRELKDGEPVPGTSKLEEYRTTLAPVQSDHDKASADVDALLNG